MIKKILIILSISTVSIFGIFFIKNNYSFNKDSGAEEKSNTIKNLHLSSNSEIGEIKHYKNERFNYELNYNSSNTKLQEPDGKDADFSSDIDSKIIFNKNGVPIFVVHRLYLDELSITEGIKSNNERMREEGTDEAYIKKYAIEKNKEFDVDRIYRDLTENEFLNKIKLSVRGANFLNRSISGYKGYDFILDPNILNNDKDLNYVPIKLGWNYVESLGVHNVLFFVGPKNEKYYIHYKPEDADSMSMLNSFKFVKDKTTDN